MRFAGGPLHGMPVPDAQTIHRRIEVEMPGGEVCWYQRGLWWEFEDVGEGEPFYGLVDADYDDVMAWARQVLRPC